MDQLINRILRKYRAEWGKFFAIGLAGSVAAGKSTLAAELSEKLETAAPNLKVSVISADSFILPNSELIKRGIFDKKGFPASYDLQALKKAIRDLRGGQDFIKIPKYSLEINDIESDAFLEVQRPDILIVEGIVALQLDDIYDYSIYLQADPKLIYQWFLARTLSFIRQSKDDPDSFYYPFSKLPISKVIPELEKTWRETNLANLLQNIQPTKEKADAIVVKGKGHQLEKIEFKDQ